MEVLDLLVSIIALVSKIPHLRSPTGMTAICPAILIAWALFAIRGLRGRTVAVTENDMPKADVGDESSGTCAFVAVLAVVVPFIALAPKTPHRRSPTVGIPSHYMQPTLRAFGCLRRSTVAVTE